MSAFSSRSRYTNGSPTAIQIQWKPRFTPISIWYSDRHKILYMARQLRCRSMRKKLLRSDGQ